MTTESMTTPPPIRDMSISRLKQVDRDTLERIIRHLHAEGYGAGTTWLLAQPTEELAYEVFYRAHDLGTFTIEDFRR